jgi:hypothetical protein
MPTKVSIAVVVATLCFSGRVAAQIETIVVGQLIIGPGGSNSFNWQINNATGTAGPTPNANNQVSGWTLLQVTVGVPEHGTHGGTFPSSGNFIWTATPNGSQFMLSLETLFGPLTPLGMTPDGPMANLDPNLQYMWPFISYQGTYSGPTDSATLTASTLFDMNAFANAIPPTTKFSIALDQANKQMDLLYTPVPEPGTLGLVAVGALAVWRAVVRRSRH